VVILYTIVGVTLGILMRNIRFDDPFITYRYAENFAQGRGFVFNANDPHPKLITTTPLYALMLAGLRTLSADIPTASYVVSVIALICGAIALYFLAVRHQRVFTGFCAGLVQVLFPLLWLTMGFETPLFLAVAIFAFALADYGALFLAGALCGIAIGLRGDGMIVLAIVSLSAWARTLPRPTTLTLASPKPNTPAQKFLAFLRANLIVERPTRLRGNIKQTLRMAFSSQSLITPLKVILPALAIYLPLALWLTLQFGSPIPNTLATKTAQAVAGLTGFYPNTTYLQGAILLLQAYREQSRFFFGVITSAAIAVSLIFIFRAMVLAFQRDRRGLIAHWLWVFLRAWQRELGLVGIILWAIAHFVGYALLGVAPYVWYYAPLVPGLALITGLFSTRRRKQVPLVALMNLPGTWLRRIIFLANCVLLVIVDLAIIAVLRGATPPSPDHIAAKILPETKVDSYRLAGEWLSANTPATATLGITELGVMSYYAQRHTIDFLGLTGGDAHRDAVRHGDFLYAVLSEQADYLALTSKNAIYDIDPQREAWFKAIYTPVLTINDTRFWGSPITIWQRTQPALSPMVALTSDMHDLGDGWKIVGVTSTRRYYALNEPLWVRLELQAGAAVGTKFLQIQPIAPGFNDGLEVMSRPIHTHLWHTGERAYVDFVQLPTRTPYNGYFELAARWQDNPTQVKIGTLKSGKLANAPAVNGLNFVPLSNGVAVALGNLTTQLCASDLKGLQLHWRLNNMGNVNYKVFAHVRDASNAIVAQSDDIPNTGALLMPTTVWENGEYLNNHILNINIGKTEAIAPGNYTLIVGLYEPNSGKRYPVDATPYKVEEGAIRLAHLQLKSCL
jgi:hypothetical protein